MKGKRGLKSLTLGIVSLLLLTILVASMVGCGEPEKTTEPTTTTTEPTTTTTEPTTTQPPETILLRMTTPVPPGDILATMAQEGMDRFNARTNGLYEMKMFPGGQLAAFPESLDAIFLVPG